MNRYRKSLEEKKTQDDREDRVDRWVMALALAALLLLLAVGIVLKFAGTLDG